MNATSAPSAPGRGSRIDQLHAARRELRERGADVVDAERDVVQPGAAPGEEFRDRRIGRGRLQQLETGRTHRDKVRPHPLARHLFRGLHLEPERVAIEAQRRVEIRHRDADVIENGFHTDSER